jgi:hypothetical protein
MQGLRRASTSTAGQPFWPRRYRLTVAGKTTNIGARHEEDSVKCPDYKLLEDRENIFCCLCKVWVEAMVTDSKLWQEDIWRKANTAQALLQYWMTTTNEDGRQKAMDIMKGAYGFYKKFLNGPKGPDVWVDDFGWWFGFFADLAAIGHPLAAPFDPANLLIEPKYCYDRMLKNRDSVEGGIWNNNDPSKREKNTVTNAWMLNVAAGLFHWTKEQKYKDMAESQYLWLTTGKYNKYSPPGDWELYNREGLLWWLPGAPKTSGVHWSGDEGVFLRGLIGYIDNVVTDPDVQNKLLQDSKALIMRAITPTADFGDPSKWKGFPDTENVMHESPASDWSNDLATGKGVFMRLVTRFAFHYKFFNDSKFEQTFQTFVDASAQSVCCTRDKTTDRTVPNWNCAFKSPTCPLGPPEEGGQPTSGDLWPQVWQTAGLDALNAAVRFHPAG